MVSSRREKLRAALQLQREMRERYGDDVEAAMAQLPLTGSATRAEQTYRAAMARNSSQRFSVNDAILPERVLQPDETVLDVAVGSLSSDTFPLVLVTDRRILLTIDQPWRRWRILREAPSAEVLSAEVEPRLLGGRLRVRLRQGKDIVLKVGAYERPKEVAALIRRLADGGHAPGREES
ncbi:PH domain-containing protein [Agrococcus sp. TF02-05]|uniref:PH domain-containing protein n=1 Tax=Agrococcus sp. TF02-05 TaxID=2815211 RepID=UPI001AA0FF2A|nr:PH domain-containing protein [Agrococcus sp. TF02-05]MBO1769910.1 PH domain-containing protein [Agrococcus sp. TF02-05]